MKRAELGGYLLFILLCLLGSLLPLGAQSLGVEAAVEKQQVFMGEAFVFQITVQGSDNPAEPVLEGFTDFDVAYMGGSTNSSQSITIINGKMEQTISRGYIFQYRLTPRRTGTLTIPAVKVVAEGRNLITNPLRITVKEPGETAEYKLRLSLSKASCYVGEPVTLSFIWYIGANADSISFNFSLLTDDRFSIEEVAIQKRKDAQYLAFPVNGQQVEFEHLNGSSSYQGKEYRTLSFKRILIPRKAGSLAIDKAFANFKGVTGYRNVQDWFGRTSRQEVYEDFVTPSNALVLNVLELPTAGQPPNFSGLIGSGFTLEVSASPVNVKVGDPITLQIALGGSSYLKDAKIPPLNTFKELNTLFKIPADQGPGRYDGDQKVFTQTLRASGVGVSQIPEFEIGYFDTAKGRYQSLRSKAIALQVEASDIKTFIDLEGMEPVEMKSGLEAWTEGIAANFEGTDLLLSRSASLQTIITHPLYILLLLLPVLVFVLLLYLTRFSHLLKVSEGEKRAKHAYTTLMRTLHRYSGDQAQSTGGEIYGLLMEELNNYLGARLKLKSGSLTFQDVQGKLASLGAQPAVLADLEKIYSECEAGHYAGGAFSRQGITDLCNLLDTTLQALERSLGK